MLVYHLCLKYRQKTRDIRREQLRQSILQLNYQKLFCSNLRVNTSTYQTSQSQNAIFVTWYCPINQRGQINLWEVKTFVGISKNIEMKEKSNILRGFILCSFSVLSLIFFNIMIGEFIEIYLSYWYCGNTGSGANERLLLRLCSGFYLQSQVTFSHYKTLGDRHLIWVVFTQFWISK